MVRYNLFVFDKDKPFPRKQVHRGHDEILLCCTYLLYLGLLFLSNDAAHMRLGRGTVLNTSPNVAGFIVGPPRMRVSDTDAARAACSLLGVSVSVRAPHLYRFKR